tara:strand:+ start:1577 stop:2830 length:1254 start_codon:yes stop_codon:yes gene_type:complete
MINSSILKISPTPLSGSVNLSGSKISAIVGLIISLSTRERFIFSNFPKDLLDVKICLKMIEDLGKKINLNQNNVTITQSKKLNDKLLSDKYSIRYTLLIIASLLVNQNKVKVPLPGGCKIGNRKIDVFEYIFKKFGVDFVISENHMTAETKKKLKVDKLVLQKVSTGGTLCALILSSTTIGKTLIENAHIRPEVIDIINLFNKMGAKISYSNNTIEVEGSDSLSGANFRLMDDIIEAFTYLILGATTKGEIKIKNYPFAYLELPTNLLHESGANIFVNNNDLIISNGSILPFKLFTGRYPQIQSELQPLFSSYALFSNGTSYITDYRFPERYQYIEELKKLGASIKKNRNGIEIKGTSIVNGGTVKALDIRCGAALIIAAICAKGDTIIKNANEIKRGYENIDLKINSLGGKINFQH